MTTPKAFITYSHDDQEHKKWVLELAIRLRNSGVDAALDQWDLQTGDDLSHFMETQIAKADKVLMVCTQRYVQRANAGTGGVGYEKMILTADLLRSIDSNKVVPLVRQHGTSALPTFMGSKLYLDFSREEQFEFSFDELLRCLHGAPLFVKPPVGNNPFTPVAATPPEKIGNLLSAVMRVVISDFESHANEYCRYYQLVSAAGMSRIMFDLGIDMAIKEGLIKQDGDGDVRLSSTGKQYALQHKLVR